MIKKVGLASMIALPLISSLAAPSAASAASGAARPQVGDSCDTLAPDIYCQASFCVSTVDGGDACCRLDRQLPKFYSDNTPDW